MHALLGKIHTQTYVCMLRYILCPTLYFSFWFTVTCVYYWKGTLWAYLQYTCIVIYETGLVLPKCILSTTTPDIQRTPFLVVVCDMYFNINFGTNTNSMCSPTQYVINVPVMWMHVCLLRIKKRIRKVLLLSRIYV